MASSFGRRMPLPTITRRPAGATNGLMVVFILALVPSGGFGVDALLRRVRQGSEPSEV